jgi:hypothetical protein
MSLIYFDAAGSLAGDSLQTNDTLIKEALVIVEGTHKDNKGVIHEFPRERVIRLANNTNLALEKGEEVPFMVDHSKELIKDGELKKLGNWLYPFELRIITEKDLPNPKNRELIGRLGAFAKTAVRHRAEDVKKGLIKLLSPGIDLARECIAEVSAVAFPAIRGPALFRAANSEFSAITYAEVKEQYNTLRNLKQKAQEYFDIMFAVLKEIDAAPAEQMLGIDTNALKRKVVDDFTVDLIALLEIEDSSTNVDEIQEVRPGAYDDLNYSKYEEESLKETEEAPVITKLKTRKKR